MSSSFSQFRLGIQCKSEPLTCESAFAAPSSGSGDSVPPLLAYIQTVFQIIDENCIPLFMVTPILVTHASACATLACKFLLVRLVGGLFVYPSVFTIGTL